MSVSSVISRIEANPNPRSVRGLFRKLASWAWGRLSPLNREAAVDSGRNVLMTIGAATVIGDFSTMKYWFIIPAIIVCAFIWFADYLRHF